MIEFYLDRTSGVATYLQLVHQVKQALRLGLLRPGDQLPTAKEVVAQLGINPNTVLKAYRELERDGLVAPRPGQGTFVQQSLASPSLAGTDRLQRALAGWVHDARAAGLTGEDMAALFDRAVRESEEGVA
jgi:GntR family transcriptional regulator